MRNEDIIRRKRVVGANEQLEGTMPSVPTANRNLD